MRLIAGPAAVTTETCPESLLLDYYRLRCWHAEFNFAVFGCTLLSRCITAMCAAQGVKRQQASAKNLQDVQNFLAAYSFTAGDDDTDTLTRKHMTAVAGAIPGFDSFGLVLNTAVHDLCRDRVLNTWTAIADGTAGPTTQLPMFARCVLRRITPHALRTKPVLKLNLAVYSTTYNQIINEQRSALIIEQRGSLGE